ncbi:cobalamin biosynthesis protein [Methanobrevibacter sp. UBA412]|jgi:adenosylcobinamide-phosphate synthase|uniref:cobalamin biosynthesis protein n=1 Tax=Methanobrevibacter sp. UBA412 TaxID=1915486 RepID=UPI0039B93F0A
MFNEIINFIFNNYNIYLIFLLILSILIDLIIEEVPSKYHFVVLIGKIIEYFKNNFINIKNRSSGVLLTFFSLISISLILIIIYSINIFLSTFLATFLTIFCNKFINNLFALNFWIIINYVIFGILTSIFLSQFFSIKMLINSSLKIKKDLKDNIKTARKSISMFVSRDTSNLNEQYIISASIESMTENITDSYVSSIFYYFLFSLIGIFFGLNYYYIIFLAILGANIHRVINTLDAMVGYKTTILANIGWFPAHLDDILNYIPSRFAGIMVVLSAYILKLNGKNSFKIFKRDSKKTPSPNSGYTMAAVAGALDIQLEKKETYILGDNNHKLSIDKIDDSVKLTKMSICLSTIILSIIFLILNFIF